MIIALLIIDALNKNDFFSLVYFRSSVRTPTDNDSCLLDLYEKEAVRF